MIKTGYDENQIYYSDQNGRYLPIEVDVYQIPVVAVDGKGTITLTTYPTQCTQLQVLSAEAGEIYLLPPQEIPEPLEE